MPKINSHIRVSNKLTGAKAKEKMVCQIGFIPLNKTLNGSISWPRLQRQTRHQDFELFITSLATPKEGKNQARQQGRSVNPFEQIKEKTNAHLLQGNREGEFSGKLRTPDDFLAHVPP